MKGAGPCRYQYRDAINGFFEIPTGTAHAILPAGLQPVEPHHGSSVLGVTAFEFHDSPAGAYREIALSISVAPRILAGESMPRAALYPFLVATTTRASRQHGIEVWRLPHHDRDLEIAFDRGERRVTVTASEGRRRLLALTVFDAPEANWQSVEHRYQTFSRDDSGSYLSALEMSGPFMEHEEERGRLELEPRAFSAAFDLGDIDPVPFREQWMKDGVETIHPLQPLVTHAAR